jgi:hypothetical protein
MGVRISRGVNQHSLAISLWSDPREVLLEGPQVTHFFPFAPMGNWTAPFRFSHQLSPLNSGLFGSSHHVLPRVETLGLRRYPVNGLKDPGSSRISVRMLCASVCRSAVGKPSALPTLDQVPLCTPPTALRTLLFHDRSCKLPCVVIWVMSLTPICLQLHEVRDCGLCSLWCPWSLTLQGTRRKLNKKYLLISESEHVIH